MRCLALALLCFLTAGSAAAHVGSPDIYLDAKAGPYPIFVTVRPPTVIPGVAQLEIRTEADGVSGMTAAPVGITGDAARFAPIADRLQASKDDPKFFTGAIWLMRTGSFEARVTVEGAQGKGIVNVPVPAVANSTKGMQPALGAVLFGLMSLLVAGLVAITGAAVRDAELEPGSPASQPMKMRGRFVMAGVFVALVLAIWFGDRWWQAEARSYGNYIYKPLALTASLSAGTDGGQALSLHITDPGWLKWRKVDDFIPDHNHLMHLYLVHEPDLNTVYHLHPAVTHPGVFTLTLPTLPEGHYKLYADVVHQNGFPETMTASIDLPDIRGRALSGDDAKGEGQPAAREFQLPDGYRMIFANSETPWRAKQPHLFRFELLDPRGAAPTDMALYMGMVGHAAFLKTDGTVFAHIHPTGSVSMAAYMMGNQQADLSGGMHAMAGMNMPLPNAVSFPYGFPAPGEYRIFVQMEHGSTVETGIFSASVK